MDLHMTLDGHVVAIHDSTVDRTTNGTGCVVAHTLAELKALDAADNFVPGQGPVDGQPAASYPFRGVATGAVAPPAGFTANDFTIATLGEIFEAVPDATMIMELKPTEVYQSHDCPAFVASLPPDQRPDLAAGVAELIDEHDMADQVMVASFIDDLMHQFQALAPEVDTSFPLGESLAVYQAFLAGDPLPNPNGHEAFQVPRAFGPITISREIVDYARANDVAVHFWTINDPAEMTELLDWGVDGLITDVPQVMSALLEARGDPQPTVGSVTALVSDAAGPTPPDQSFTVTASVMAAWPHPEVVGSVDLVVDDQVLATADITGGQATFSVVGLEPGSHTLVASYAGSPRVLASVSDPLTHQVTAPPTTTSTSTPTTTVTTMVAATTPTAALAAPPPAGPAAASPRSTTSLPVTGSGLTVAWLGLALALAGAVLVAVTRRRRRA
jgi:glycerophosphoryl diester phosphodiesterase